MQAFIEAIEYHLPEAVLTTEALAAAFPEWSVEKIDAKTGIAERHIAGADETAADLAVKAAAKLFAKHPDGASRVDYILFCTQSPDHFLPTTACLIQDRLGLSTKCGAIDFNLGCSGYVYGLGLAQALIASGQAACVLFLTGETYSKYLHTQDKSVRTIFGDAAAATLISALPSEEAFLGPFIYGTDGRGGQNLIVKNGASRAARLLEPAALETDDENHPRSGENLFMDGAEIFTFTLSAVPDSVEALLKKSSMSLDDIDLFVFHQANKYMLEHLRKKLKLPAEKFYIAMRHCGNTVSSTIPIALKHASEEGRLTDGARIMLVGFGVGYSWGATIVRWRAA